MENEKIMQFSMIQQEAEKMSEQLEIIDRQIMDFSNLKESIDKIEEKDEELLSPIGKGIFVKSKLSEKRFYVNVGQSIVLKKTGKDAKEIIDKQVNQLLKLKEMILENIESLNLQLREIAESIEN